MPSPQYPIPFAMQLFPSMQIVFGDSLGNIGGPITVDVLNQVFGDDSCCGDVGPESILADQEGYDLRAEQYVIGGMDPVVFLGSRPE
jgi:hypothetical protein